MDHPWCAGSFSSASFFDFGRAGFFQFLEALSCGLCADGKGRRSDRPGGEPLARPQEAARLYSHGVAPVIYVTGEGDSARNRQVLMSSGVPSSAILLETKATTTFGNAMLLKPLLEKAHVTSALIVTSPFHSRRALATFRKLIPGVRFGVVDASISWWEKPQGQGDVNRFALVEFLKILEYRLLYGVSPFLKSSI